FIAAKAITIQADNAFLPAELRNTMIAAGETSFTMGRLNYDLPMYGDTNRNQTRRFAVGAEGSFGDGWSWDAYYTSGENVRSNHYGGDTFPQNRALATDAVVDPSTGRIVCRSSLANPSNGCVPINWFGSSAPSPQAIAYIL